MRCANPAGRGISTNTDKKYKIANNDMEGMMNKLKHCLTNIIEYLTFLPLTGQFL